MKTLEKSFNKIKRLLKKPCHKIYGDYYSFEEAEKHCGSYDDERIFSKVFDSSMKVKNGEASYERDGVCFYDKQVNYNLFMYLLELYAENGFLNVLDFGGALGSTYWQHKDIIDRFDKIKWNVVEQKRFAELGKKFFETDALLFWENDWNLTFLQEHINGINCVLLSSVLQYFPDYRRIIDFVDSFNPRLLIIERNPVGQQSRICIEEVHEPIYESTRPFVCQEETELIAYLVEKNYCLVDNWNSLVDGKGFIVDDKRYVYKSFVFVREERKIKDEK